MLKRKITDKIKDWYQNNDSALLIDWARQIGKTTSILAFFKEAKLDYAELNLLENRLAIEAFNTSTDARQLMLRISALVGKELKENKTIIFIDEIQEAADAITPIKFLIQQTQFRFVFSGSLLGIKIQSILSMPVGFLTVHKMYPLDFEEFMMAFGISEKKISYFNDCFLNKKIVDNIIHTQMMNLFHIYMVVGGMPKAVTTFLEYNDINKVNQVLYDIDNGYRNDVSKYEKESGQKLRIQELYDLIPNELNAANKRFLLKDFNKKARFYQLESSFIWLKNSGIGLFVHNVDNPVRPLLASKEKTLFKLFLCDIGLLSYKLCMGHQIDILNGNDVSNFGALYEAIAAMELSSHGYELFYNNDKKRGEIDFLIEDSNKVIPLEIKSGKDYKRHSALSQLLSNPAFSYQEGYVFYNGNTERKGKTIYYPIYMLMFLKRTAKKSTQKITPDISHLL